MLSEQGIKYFVYVVIGIVIASVAVSLLIVGSPTSERTRQFDERRVNDLQNIQRQVVNYWQQKGSLPENLEVLTDPISGFRVPADPVTGALYEYASRGGYSFELCAIFSLPSGGRDVPEPVAHPVKRGFSDTTWNWEHGAGRVCFERTIDPDMYKQATTPIGKLPASSACLVTGCSRHVCASEEVMTTCEFLPEYSCYEKNSLCERQPRGQCGWTPTDALVRCLSDARKRE